MSLPFPISTDTPAQVAILPDWAEGIRQSIVYRTDVTRSHTGLEQRMQRRKRPLLAMEYNVAVNGADARRRLETVLAMNRTPLLVPWWVSGARLSVDMASDTTAVLASDPISDEWDHTGWVFFWSRKLGIEWRQLASRNGRTLTLTDTGIHTDFEAGDYVFPVRLAVRDRGEELLASPQHRTAIDKLIFRTL